MKKYDEFPFWVKLIGTPFVYIMAIVRVFMTLPIYVIAKCNEVTKNIQIK